MAEDLIIGIDLGTTNSVVAVMEGGEAKVIPNPEGNRTTPSVVAFTEKGERLVGEPAKRQAVMNPARTVYSIKRFMGRRHSEVQDEEKLVPYNITGGADDPVKVEIDGKEHTPPEISAMVLRKLKESAEAYLGQKVRKAVITVPAYFNDGQRQATIEAAQIAGFDTEWEIEDPATGNKTKQRMRIINEPTAASLAYGLGKNKSEKIAVFDLGGGTFDISVLDVNEGLYQVESTNGDTHLGGDDFDQVIIDWVAEEFLKENDVDLRKDQLALQRLKEAAERAKKDLSSQTTTDINIPFILNDPQTGPKHVQATLTRAKFEQLADKLTERCRGPVLRALEDAKMKPGDIDEVVLVGGMTRMPKVQALVKEIFGKEGHKGVNPDEVVAIGAAIQGAQLLLGSKSEVLLVDVTPLTLGIETMGGVLTPLIPRNTSIPKDATEMCTTVEDNQPGVTVQIYQGEGKLTSSAGVRKLGQFDLEIAPAPRGMPKIEVKFALDHNGILNVTAKDLATGKENNIEIKGSSGLSEDEVERMRKEAETNAEADKHKLDLINARNEADSVVFQLEKQLKELGDKLPENDKAPLLSAIEKTKQAMSGEDVPAIRRSVEELQQAASAMGQALYSQGEGAAAGAPAPDAEAPAGSEDDDVQDAEFEVKK